ncbi:MAG: RIP metalloprotease RseP [Candidatus Firestonebacteria bacterium]|nr:RIP metalloprotease RseP [Candidatus Firestonebacteria bacterium]
MQVFHFIIILGLVVLAHELGHFFIAKLVGIKVEKFSMGMGPKIFGIKRGETEYLLSLLPVGGYVKMAGEEPEEENEDKESDKNISEEDKKMKFYNKTVIERAAVIAAGPIMNVILAVFIFTVVFMVGIPLLAPTVGDVLKNSAAQEANIQKGDKIIAIGENKIELWEDLTDIIHSNPGKKLTLTLLRKDKKIYIDIVPAKEKVTTIFNEEIEIGLIGITPGKKPEYIIERYNPFTSFIMALNQTYAVTVNMYKALVMMLSRKIKAEITGPIGIFSIAKEKAESGLSNLWTFVAILSINLGIINLLPFPVLDGGHLVFLLIEKIKGTPVKVKYREIAQQVGAIVLIALTILITYKDILRLYH